MALADLTYHIVDRASCIIYSEPYLYYLSMLTNRFLGPSVLFRFPSELFRTFPSLSVLFRPSIDDFRSLPFYSRMLCTMFRKCSLSWEVFLISESLAGIQRYR